MAILRFFFQQEDFMFKSIQKALKNVWKDESGQGATEYILMLVVVVAIAFAFRKQIVKVIGERTGEAGDKLKGAIDNLGNSN